LAAAIETSSPATNLSIIFTSLRSAAAVMAINLPVYLDAEVQAYLSARAKARGVEVGQLVNELLKKDIELIEAAR
jgi:hypothetical protein